MDNCLPQVCFFSASFTRLEMSSLASICFHDWDVSRWGRLLSQPSFRGGCSGSRHCIWSASFIASRVLHGCHCLSGPCRSRPYPFCFGFITWTTIPCFCITFFGGTTCPTFFGFTITTCTKFCCSYFQCYGTKSISFLSFSGGVFSFTGAFDFCSHGSFISIVSYGLIFCSARSSRPAWSIFLCSSLTFRFGFLSSRVSWENCFWAFRWSRRGDCFFRRRFLRSERLSFSKKKNAISLIKDETSARITTGNNLRQENQSVSSSLASARQAAPSCTADSASLRSAWCQPEARRFSAVSTSCFTGDASGRCSASYLVFV